MSLILATLLALAAQDAAAEASESAPTEAAEVAIPEKIPAPDAEENAPTVTIRTGDNGDVIQEYRQSGRVTMIKITPKRGPSYYLIDADGDGRIDGKDGDGVVAPVYWKIYEWN